MGFVLTHMADKSFGTKMTLTKTCAPLPLIVLLASCGGGGGSGGAAAPPPPVAVSCPTNHVAVGSACQCPSGLVDNPQDGYCTDPGFTVLRGAEYLEPGFPVIAETGGGVGYLPMYTKVGNIDSDPEMEIFHKNVGTEFLAWNHDGTVVPGYSVFAATTMHGKMVLAQLDGDANDELFIGHEGTAVVGRECEFNAFDHQGDRLPGYPAPCPDRGSVKIAPVVVDFDDDGTDEVLFTSTRNVLGIFRSPADIQPFGVSLQNVQFAYEWCGLAAGDLTNDSVENIIALTCPYSKPPDSTFYQSVYAFDSAGDVVSGFPVETTTFREHQPLIGDVDGDGMNEIIAMTFDGVAVISPSGDVEATIDRSGFTGYPGIDNYPFMALADVDSNGTADVLFYQSGIHAMTAAGVELSGFPVNGETFFAVGDVDGDNAQEVVSFRNAITSPSNSPVVHLVVFEADGTQKNLEITIDQVGDPGRIMPTISDIDLDGRNEIIVTGDYWTGTSGDYYKVWVFDLGGAAISGDIEWGQKFGDRHNSGAHRTARD